MPDNLDGLTDDELKAAISELEGSAAPLQQRLAAIRAEVDGLRTELRRRLRMAQLDQRKAVRADLAAGKIAALVEVVSGAIDLGGSGVLDDYRFFRDSATEVRLGYASSSRQSLSFSDGKATEEADNLATASQLFLRGWEFGTPQARGVRVYAAGTRAERVVPATDIHVEARIPPVGRGIPPVVEPL
jgi:hypothetical protein